METKIFTDKLEDIKEAAEIIASGGLVAFPTETVYGLGADALNAEAVGKVYAAKGRPSDNPMIVHIWNGTQLNYLTDEVTEDMELLMKAFWPGPMTMVVKRKPIVPDVTTGGLDTVGVRCPSNEVARNLIRFSRTPIAAPSANLSGKPSPTSAQHCIDDLTGRVEAVIKSGDCQFGIESTVVDMTGENPMILRPGMITKEMMEAVLHKEVLLDPTLLKRPDLFNNGDFKPKAPGMKYKHYAPEAEMVIFQGEREKVKEAIETEKLKAEKEGKKVGVIVYEDESLAAHDFFAKLRAFDKEKVDIILAAALAEEGVGFSVMNRMFKSAGYNIKEIK
ncbi:MAG: threonylcarbamoyl-AMP synthase [Clostridia bacterium]|nr:threonylcarbamoyl-AMP synthase [Clostridia bacterium]